MFLFSFIFVIFRYAKYEKEENTQNRFVLNQHGNYNSKLNLSNCIFESISHFGKGGAILHFSSSSVFIKHTMFRDVHSHDDGGVLYKVKGKISLIFVCIVNCSSFKTSSPNSELSNADNLVSNTISCNRCFSHFNASSIFLCGSVSGSSDMQNTDLIDHTSLKFRSGNTTIFAYNNSKSVDRGSGLLSYLYKSPLIMLFANVNNGENKCCLRCLGSKSSSSVSWSNFINNTVDYLIGDESVSLFQCSFFYNKYNQTDNMFIGVQANSSFADFTYTNIWAVREEFKQKIYTNTPLFCDVGTYPTPEKHGLMDFLLLPPQAKT